jgi:hypothetical protein
MPFLDIVGEDSLVKDYQRAAGEIFPLMVKADNAFLREQYGIAFANILGNPGEFYQYVTGAQGERSLNVEKLVCSFKKNLVLIVGKTWVESDEEEAREGVVAEMEAFIRAFQSASYARALKSFIALSEKLARLIFGDLAGQSDFLSYAFRIEPKFGLFVWYLEELRKGEAEERPSGRGHRAEFSAPDAAGAKADVARLELLVGMFYLSTL